jgi:hypothetical protein
LTYIILNGIIVANVNTHNFFILAVPGVNMAENTVNIGINVSDNGTTAGITKNVQNLKDVLDQAAASATKIGSGTPTAGSATTSRITAASAPSSMSFGERREYGTSRAVGGGTGAEARDFAKESAGLGGVVRLYAVFAANIYAVSTAFEVLSKANAADRMIKASEMLSIQMGANLKNISKNLQEATDYSLSFQEATQFTNMGIAAGIAGKQIENLTRIAKGAASALGRDTGESIRRIITGTAKQEQEILDELGIFVKAKDAYKEYAAKFDIKGGADALSAQQKVSAYANAVEKAGEKWKAFADIPDPFSKFKAKGSEALQELLSNINKLITPIISFLAESSDRIKAIMVLISVLLVRRALPELKGLFTNLFTFDAAQAKAAGDVARLTAVKQYADITSALEAKQAERAALMNRPTSSTVAQAVGGLASVKGVPGGINVASLSSAIAAKDLVTYTSIHGIQTEIARDIAKQLALEADKTGLIQKQIDLGILSKAATVDNIILGKESIIVSEKLLLEAKSKAIVEAETLALQTKQLTLSKELTAMGAAGGKVPLGPTGGAPTTAGTPVTPIASAAGAIAATKAEDDLAAARLRSGAAAGVSGAAATGLVVATTRVTVATVEAVTMTQAFNMALAKSAAAHERLATTMGLGTIASLRIMGSVLAQSFMSILKWEAGIGAAAVTATVFGNAVVFAGVAVGTLAKAFMQFLGPIMLVWAAWDIFGDKIKELLGISTDLTKKQEELDKQNKTSNETIGLMGASLDLLNTKRKDQIQTYEDLAAAHRIEASAMQEARAAFDAASKAESDVTKQSLLDAAKAAAAKRNDVFSERAYFFEQLANNTELTESQRKEYKEQAVLFQNFANGRIAMLDKIKTAEDAAGGARANRDYLRSQNSPVASEQANTKVVAADKEAAEARNRLTDSTKELDAAGVKLLDNNKARLEQSQSLDAATLKSSAVITKGWEDVEKRRKEIADPTSKIKDVKVEEMRTNLVKLFDMTGSVMQQEGRRKIILDSLTDAQKNTVEGTKSHAKAVLLLNIYTASLEKNDKDLIKTLADVKDAMDELFGAVEKSLKQAPFRAYTDAAEAGFIKLKAEINKTGLDIKRTDMEIANISAIDARIKSIQGYSNALQIAALNKARNDKADLEFTNANKTAQLEYDRIISKKDQEGDPKARKLANDAALVALNLAKETADLNKKAALAGNVSVNINDKIAVSLAVIGKRYEEIDRTISVIIAKNNATLTLDKARVDALSQLNAYSETGLALRTRSLEAAKIESDYLQATSQAQKDKDKAQTELNAKIQDSTKLTEEEKIAQDEIKSIYDTKIALAIISNKLAQETLKISTETKLNLAAQNELVEKQNFALSQLETLKARELITNDEYLAKKKLLSLASLEQAADREKGLAIKALTADLVPLGEKLTALSIVGADTTALDNEVKATRAATTAKLEGIDRVKAAKVDQAKWDANQNERQIGYTETFKTAFSSMSDAVAEFAKTGKLNFKSLIDDMLANLIKLEMNMAMKKMVGEGGFGGLATKAIGYLFGAPAVPSGSFDTMPGSGAGSDPRMNNAKGGAFDGGIKAFAMGGAFANSIVSSPTIFKFASGTGLMGEAGPEAIMPLKRDSNGNLGVRAGSNNSGGNVEIVVNNYGNQQATTKESTDSRGNRKVEVMVGDMTAGEINRSGSSSQKSIQSTYGLQPALIRR